MPKAARMIVVFEIQYLASMHVENHWQIADDQMDRVTVCGFAAGRRKLTEYFPHVLPANWECMLKRSRTR